jgi:hypothetical protein
MFYPAFFSRRAKAGVGEFVKFKKPVSGFGGSLRLFSSQFLA